MKGKFAKAVAKLVSDLKRGLMARGKVPCSKLKRLDESEPLIFVEIQVRDEGFKINNVSIDQNCAKALPFEMLWTIIFFIILSKMLL